MNKSFLNKLFKSHQSCQACPSPESVADFFVTLLGTLFADFAQMSFATEAEFEKHVLRLKQDLDTIVQIVPSTSAKENNSVSDEFFDNLPDLFQQISDDVTAMFEGDPAAKSRSEVIRTYPGFYAIAAYRVAHKLHQLNVKEIPRVITEHAHSKTGIDIHPAAVIGSHFCIDHGTGVVIGETAVIGDRVKIYQGVTLGALSVSKEDALKKRHPTLQDNVVVYAGATILGGETIVGHDSIIGGNVWLTRTVPPHSKIYYQATMYNGDTGATDMVIFKSAH